MKRPFRPPSPSRKKGQILLRFVRAVTFCHISSKFPFPFRNCAVSKWKRRRKRRNCVSLCTVDSLKCLTVHNSCVAYTNFHAELPNDEKNSEILSQGLKNLLAVTFADPYTITQLPELRKLQENSVYCIANDAEYIR